MEEYEIKINVGKIQMLAINNKQGWTLHNLKIWKYARNYSIKPQTLTLVIYAKI